MELLGNEPPSGGDFESALAALREHLGELQLPQIAHGRRAIILFEGPEGAGKKHALRQLAAAFDPCHYAVHCTRHDRREAAEGHWLARFWSQLPSAGDTAVFFRSWYRRVLDDRMHGRTDVKALARAFDEINEFEAQQRDYGTLIVKLFFDVSADVQDATAQGTRQRPVAAGHPLRRSGPRPRPRLRRGASGPAQIFGHALVAVADDRRQRPALGRSFGAVGDRRRLG